MAETKDKSEVLGVVVRISVQNNLRFNTKEVAMSFDGHFGLDFHHVPTLDEIQQLAAAYLPDNVTLPTVPDVSHLGDDLPKFDHIGGHGPTPEEIQQLAAAYLPDDVTLPTVPDVSHVGDSLPKPGHDGGHDASIQASAAKISLNHHDSFDFSKVTPHVVKDSGPGWSTTKITWNDDSSTHTGPGSSSWSSSSSSADASTVPGPILAQTHRNR
ncbi:MAG: hypothetical protein INR70_19270 [Parafilimonas terrae]|nr:hypothetical protein [Parafilimonas terrae]